MSIYVYTGTVGTGKSLHAAHEIRFQLNRRSPRPVVANFPIRKSAVRHPECFTYVPNDELSPQFLVDFATRFWSSVDFFREDYINLVIDEAQLLFNSRRWSSSDRMAFLEFFSQSRKYGYKVIFIAQSAKMIDNQFRMLIEFEVNHRRFSSMGVIGGVLGLLTLDRVFMHVTYLFQTNERLGAGLYLLRMRDVDVYDSYARFERQSNT